MEEDYQAMGAMSQRLDLARRGEAEALGALYRQFLPGVFGYIAARVPDRSTAEDLTSEVFLKMVEGIGRLRASDEAGFAAWLLQIARVSVAGYYRKRAHLPVLASLELEDGEELAPGNGEALVGVSLGRDPAEIVEAREEWHRVVTAINALTEEQRQVLVGRLILGYDVATVARLLGKQANAVKALQFRALHRLQRLLGKREPSGQAVALLAKQRGGNP